MPTHGYMRVMLLSTARLPGFPLDLSYLLSFIHYISLAEADFLLPFSKLFQSGKPHASIECTTWQFA